MYILIRKTGILFSPQFFCNYKETEFGHLANLLETNSINFFKQFFTIVIN